MSARKELIRSLLPRSKFVERAASKARIRMLYQYAIPAGEVEKAENDPAARSRAAGEYLRKWPKEAASINSLIDAVFEDIPAYHGRTDLDEVRADMAFCDLAYGFTPAEYFNFGLEHKSAEERRSFVSNRERIMYRCRMNSLADADIFKDKIKTYEKFGDLFRREAIEVSRPEHYERFLAYVRKHPVFVKKQVMQSLGKSVELVDMAACGKTEKELFDEILRDGKHILEERIVQSRTMAAFNESSVNTVRCVTFRTRSGVAVPYCILRMGRNGAFVDNGGAGGIVACVDYATGEILTDGHDESGGVYERHPDTQTVIKGARLPDWEQLQEICRTAPLRVPTIRYIGWDLAHTDGGWVVVEGNESCQLIAQQMAQQKGIKAAIEDCLKDMDLIV